MKIYIFRKQEISEQETGQTLPRSGQPYRNTDSRFSKQLINKHFAKIIIIIVIIIIFLFIPLGVRLILQYAEMIAKKEGLEWLSLSGSLGNWFAFFGSYFGGIATVVLGFLAARLTIKQDQNKDYADISDLELSNFCLYDLWRYYKPSCYGEDLGRRFVLSFEIKGLKTYYHIEQIDAFWSSSEDDKAYMPLSNLKIKQEQPSNTSVKLCFDDFNKCDTNDSLHYFFRMGCYEYKMMPIEDRQRWLKLLFEIHYADGSSVRYSVRYVECRYCLEYTGVENGFVRLTPVDHKINILKENVDENNSNRHNH